MKKVYLLTTCEKIIAKRAKYLVYFHFKGVYLGQKINQIVLDSQVKLMEKADYFLLLEVKEVQKGVLYGSIVRFRIID